MTGIKSYALCFTVSLLMGVGGIILGMTVVPPMLEDVLGKSANSTAIESPGTTLANEIDNKVKELVINRMVKIEKTERYDGSAFVSVVGDNQRCEIMLDTNASPVVETSFQCQEINTLKEKLAAFEEKTSEIADMAINAILDATGVEAVEEVESAEMLDDQAENEITSQEEVVTDTTTEIVTEQPQQ